MENYIEHMTPEKQARADILSRVEKLIDLLGSDPDSLMDKFETKNLDDIWPRLVGYARADLKYIYADMLSYM